VSNRRSMPRRWFGRLTLLAVGMSIVIGAVLLHTLDSQGLDRLRRDIQVAAPWLSLIRLTVIAGLVIAWPPLLRFCRQCDWINAEIEQQLVSRRARLAMWLVALELILGLDVLNHVHALLAG